MKRLNARRKRLQVLGWEEPNKLNVSGIQNVKDFPMLQDRRKLMLMKRTSCKFGNRAALIKHMSVFMLLRYAYFIIYSGVF